MIKPSLWTLQCVLWRWRPKLRTTRLDGTNLRASNKITTKTGQNTWGALRILRQTATTQHLMQSPSLLVAHARKIINA